MAQGAHVVIRRLLDRLARHLMDTAWLRGMRKSEVDSLRAVHHLDRRARQGNPITTAAFPEHHHDRGRS